MSWQLSAISESLGQREVSFGVTFAALEAEIEKQIIQNQSTHSAVIHTYNLLSPINIYTYISRTLLDVRFPSLRPNHTHCNPLSPRRHAGFPRSTSLPHHHLLQAGSSRTSLVHSETPGSSVTSSHKHSLLDREIVPASSNSTTTTTTSTKTK